MFSKVLCFALLAVAVSASGCNFPGNYPVLDNCCNNAPLALSNLDSYQLSGCGNVYSPSIVQPSVKVLSNNCQCVKTIAKPQLVSRIIEKPMVRQYQQAINKKVLQKIVYRTKGASAVYPSSNLYSNLDYNCGAAPLNVYDSYPSQVESYPSYPCADNLVSYPSVDVFPSASVCGPVYSSPCADNLAAYPSVDVLPASVCAPAYPSSCSTLC